MKKSNKAWEVQTLLHDRALMQGSKRYSEKRFPVLAAPTLPSRLRDLLQSLFPDTGCLSNMKKLWPNFIFTDEGANAAVLIALQALKKTYAMRV